MNLLIQIDFNLFGAYCIFRRTSDSDEAGNQVFIKEFLNDSSALLQFIICILMSFCHRHLSV